MGLAGSSTVARVTKCLASALRPLSSGSRRRRLGARSSLAALRGSKGRVGAMPKLFVPKDYLDAELQKLRSELQELRKEVVGDLNNLNQLVRGGTVPLSTGKTGITLVDDVGEETVLEEVLEVESEGSEELRAGTQTMEETEEEGSFRLS